MKNERTSKRVASIAGKILVRSAGRRSRDRITFTADGTCVTWGDLRALAASALTQTADKEKRYHPDVPQPVMDNVGFDPRDGGKIGREFIPKSPQVRKALRGKLGKKRSSSPFYPSAKPPKHSL